mmetsp:Transcript_7270/g.23298  ORF Transcript_7270/g.23298 Transcript_7270/m.23298 type:complete len:140 (-) Transcript_7270:7-426(-)
MAAKVSAPVPLAISTSHESPPETTGLTPMLMSSQLSDLPSDLALPSAVVPTPRRSGSSSPKRPPGRGMGGGRASKTPKLGAGHDAARAAHAASAASSSSAEGETPASSEEDEDDSLQRMVAMRTRSQTKQQQQQQQEQV